MSHSEFDIGYVCDVLLDLWWRECYICMHLLSLFPLPLRQENFPIWIIGYSVQSE